MSTPFMGGPVRLCGPLPPSHPLGGHTRAGVPDRAAMTVILYVLSTLVSAKFKDLIVPVGLTSLREWLAAAGLHEFWRR